MENWIIWLIFAGLFCALLVLHVAAGGFTGVTLPVSLLSLGVSAGLGIPGVTMLLLLNLIWA